MRSIVCILFAFQSLGNISAQPYIPMLANITEWHAVTCLNGCGIDSYSSSGDTLVSGQHYQVLDGFHYIQGNFLIREDVQERKVYMKLLVQHTLLDEYPLYDFSLNDGDTTHVYNPISPLPEDGGLYVLDSIVSRPLVNGLHRHFYLHAIDPNASQSERTVWIEGVGSLSLINSPGASSTEGEHLGCAFVDGMNRYARLDSISSCEILNDIPVHETEQLTLMPSVFREQVRIVHTEPFQGGELQVYTVSGSLVFSMLLNGQTNISIDSQHLPKGMLVFVLTNEIGNSYRAKGVNIGQ